MKFEILYLDPPWSYNKRANPQARFGLGAGGHYPMLSWKELKALPIQEVCSENCVLFLWVTWPKLEHQLEVLKAWSFSYKTIGFIWVKTNPKSGTLFFGPGFYSKAGSEPCLLATRGKVLKPESNFVSSTVIAPRGKHSAKPQEVRHRIEQLYPSRSKLELFAREQSPGWTSLGLDLGSGDIRDSLCQLASL